MYQSRKIMNFLEYRRKLQRLATITDKEKLVKLLNALVRQEGFKLQIEKYEPGARLWRIVDLPRRGIRAADFGYPPKPELCGLGRCNQAEQQVFYASPQLATCLSETKNLRVGTQKRAGTWIVKTPFWCFNIFNQSSSNSRSSKFYKKLEGLFSYIGDEHYQQTSIISDWILGEFSGTLANMTPPVSGLSYVLSKHAKARRR